MNKSIYKLLIGTIGKILPLKRHPGGEIGNKIRCYLAKKIITSMGKDCVIEKGAEIQEGCILGDRVGIGPDCVIGANCVFKGHSMMAPNVHIYTENHSYNPNTHLFEGFIFKPVIIGAYTWLGYGVIVLPGVTIGNHTIIGAGSVVTHDIPNGVLAAGNP